jgi:hypothetical protein
MTNEVRPTPEQLGESILRGVRDFVSRVAKPMDAAIKALGERIDTTRCRSQSEAKLVRKVRAEPMAITASTVHPETMVRQALRARQVRQARRAIGAQRAPMAKMVRWAQKARTATWLR